MKNTWSDFLSVFSMYAVASILALYLMGTYIIPFIVLSFLYIFATLAEDSKVKDKVR